MIFYWDAWNRDHATRHGVTENESRYAIEHMRQPDPQPAGDDKLSVWGPTVDGRLLQVVYVELPPERIEIENLTWMDLLKLEEGAKITYIIHARELTWDEKRIFRRRR